MAYLAYCSTMVEANGMDVGAQLRTSLMSVEGLPVYATVINIDVTLWQLLVLSNIVSDVTELHPQPVRRRWLPEDLAGAGGQGSEVEP